MRVALVYDLRDDYRALGFSEEQVAEFDSVETVDQLAGALETLGCAVVRVGRGQALAALLVAGERYDLVFSIAEGMKGRSREAQVPALCELLGIPYTGSGVLASALAMDKLRTKRIWAAEKLPTPAYQALGDDTNFRMAARKLGLPLMVKPASEGSSIGMSKVRAATKLEEAYRLAGRAQAFADEECGGWFVGDQDLVARRKEFDDHPTPSGNSMMAYVALRLARIWADEGLERAAVGSLRLARPLMERAPTALGHMLCALDLHFSTPREVAVVGESDELLRSALAGFQPNTVFAFAPEPTESVPLLAGKGLVDGLPAAYVCERFACQAPVTSPTDLEAALA